MTKLWQTLLGTLVISSLACGDGSSTSGPGHDGGGGLDGTVAVADGAPAAMDLAPGAIDQATSGLDLATAAVDQAPGVDQVTVAPDAAADVRLADVAPDMPMQPDLYQAPDLFVKKDLPPGPDLYLAPDVPQTQDLRPPADVTVVLDASQTDLPPAQDTSPGLDTSSGIDGTGAVDGELQVLWPDKLIYGPGEQLTAGFNDGSPDASAWIGIFQVGAADTAYQEWAYTGGATSGTVLLHVPETPGAYELRMFQDGGYTRIATSLPFAVQ